MATNGFGVKSVLLTEVFSTTCSSAVTSSTGAPVMSVSFGSDGDVELVRPPIANAVTFFASLPEGAINSLVNKFLGSDPAAAAQNNMFVLFGQRYFSEMVTSNMLMMRANMKKLVATGGISQQDYDAFENMQHKMYDPMLGINQPQSQFNMQPQAPIPQQGMNQHAK